MQKQRTLNIIGCGRVGTVFGRLLTMHGQCRILGVVNESSKSSIEAVELMKQGNAYSAIGSLEKADITMITTPDDRIETICNELVSGKKLAKGSLLFHCSGALSSNIFKEAQKIGVFTASVHPVRSFSNPQMPIEEFSGTWCGVEGMHEACDLLKVLLDPVGARIFSLNSENKALYHIGSVMVSNYLTTLLDLGAQIYQKSGIPKDITADIMEPLIQGALKNFLKEGAVKSLTGPISRGDISTIESHLKVLKETDSSMTTLYKKLGQKTVDLTAKKEELEIKILQKMQEILK